MKDNSFQSIIAALNNFWQQNECSVVYGIDTEVGAGTLHSMTALRCLDTKPLNVCYVQPVRRPSDGRYGLNPNRLQHYYQYQVILKPAPENIQDLCVRSLAAIGIDSSDHDIRFVEDDWENPTIGAWGLGWEVWCDGMEIMQFTYMQQIGGIDLTVIPAELTYGLERIAMYVQNKSHFKDIVWNNPKDPKHLMHYGDIFLEEEKQFTDYYLNYANVEILRQNFIEYEKETILLCNNKLAIPAYNCCLKAGHTFNMLESRGVLSVTERAQYISRVRNLAKMCCSTWLEVQ